MKRWNSFAPTREVEAIYVSSPHQLHAQHVQAAAKAGKHVLVEKPMAITIEQCDTMIDAARNAGIHLIVGHSHSFDRPILRLRELIESGEFGAVRMINAAELHRLSLSSPAAGGACHRARRRCCLQPGRAPDRHRAA